MSEFDDTSAFDTGKVLGIDGDIMLYRPCCVFTDDDELSKRNIAKTVSAQITKMMLEADCDNYVFFLTTRKNFRDDLVDDYKANRKDVERPVNLSWAKQWAVDHLNSNFYSGLEADDLLGIFMEQDNTVLWSIDKDLRQIAGLHLDDETRKVKVVDNLGSIVDKGKEIYFDGMVGFYFQCLTGDPTDNIVGCGKRLEQVYKSGAKKGQAYTKRKGVGPKAAFQVLMSTVIKGGSTKEILDRCLLVLQSEYRKVYGEDWLVALETGANLLWMVREQHGEVIRRWTYNGREEYFDMTRGVILEDYSPSEDQI